MRFCIVKLLQPRRLFLLLLILVTLVIFLLPQNGFLDFHRRNGKGWREHFQVLPLPWYEVSALPKLASPVVPNVVHYVWFGEAERMKFHQFLAIKSAYAKIKPDKILFHCDYEPIGTWWHETQNHVPTLEIVQRDAPKRIFGHIIAKPGHKSDVARLEILLKDGGIFLGADVIVLKSFEPLRHYNVTMGIEYNGNPGRLNNDIILAQPGAKFLKIWYETYQNFTHRDLDYHASQIPYILMQRNPNLIHVEERTLNYPSGKDWHLIFKERYDWRENYAIHLWEELDYRGHGPKEIETLNTTFGEIARLIYYGNPALVGGTKKPS